MRRTIAVATGVASLAWFLLIAVPSISAFPLTTCTLTVTSRDASGSVVSTASEAGGGTRDDPFIVDPKGTVEWSGTTGGSPIANASYHVEIFGVPTPLQGSASGDNPRSSASGVIDLGEILPVDLAGLIFVSGALESGGAPVCEGSGWIKIAGDPVPTPGFVAGAALALVGLASVLSSVRGRHPFRGAIGGLLGGAGLALLSGVTGILPLDEQTPLVEVIAAVILGLAIGVIDFGSLFHRGSVAAVDAAGRPDPKTEPPAGPSDPGTTPATTPVVPVGPPVVGPPVVGPPVVLVPPPVVVPPPVLVPPPVGPPPVVAPPPEVPPPPISQASGPTDGSKSELQAKPPEPKPGLPTIQARIKAALTDPTTGTTKPVYADAETILNEAQGILTTGPGTLTIGSDLISRITSPDKPAASPVQLVDGAIEVDVDPTGLGLVSLTATPVVQNGKLSLEFNSLGSAANAAGALDGLTSFVEQVNIAVANAGQSITSVSITPGGIAISTGPAIP
jgi:hypothetical protein